MSTAVNLSTAVAFASCREFGGHHPFLLDGMSDSYNRWCTKEATISGGSVNSRQLAQVGLGLIGVLALVYALNGLSTMAAMAVASQEPAFAFVVAALPLAALAALSYVLVFHNVQIAAAIAPHTKATSESGTPDVGRILVVLLGVFLLVEAIPGALNAALTLRDLAEFGGSSRTAVTAHLLSVVIQIAIALYLIVRPERLLDYVQRPLAQPAE